MMSMRRAPHETAIRYEFSMMTGGSLAQLWFIREALFSNPFAANVQVVAETRLWRPLTSI
jgi:hypothetical protein